MPTKKFFDLSEDKRKAFIDAAIMEFERQSFDEASIYNIARNAGVSRTGIYYYFTNKQDIYEYLLTLNRDRFFDSFDIAPEHLDLLYGYPSKAQVPGWQMPMFAIGPWVLAFSQLY